jgi:hemerythrin-like domain-containing protein
VYQRFFAEDSGSAWVSCRSWDPMDLASLAQLDRSHRRHDDVMGQLLDAARRLAAGRPHDTDVDVVRDAVAYFARAVTRHFLDEEGSVFPRLSTRRPDLAGALAALSAEHPAQIALQNAVAECAKQLDGESRFGVGKQLLEVAERLADLHRNHVAKEDEIFAASGDALTPQDDADIVAEMETRRGRDEDVGVGAPAFARRRSLSPPQLARRLPRRRPRQ